MVWSFRSSWHRLLEAPPLPPPRPHPALTLGLGRKREKASPVAPGQKGVRDGSGSLRQTTDPLLSREGKGGREESRGGGEPENRRPWPAPSREAY